MSPATLPSKLTVRQLGFMYMQQYSTLLNASQEAMCKANEIDPNRKFYSWDEFWQIYNKLWNAKQYEGVLLHVKMNYLSGFNRGKF